MNLEKSKSRYAEVCRILDAAAGKSDADYGGLGRFWSHGLNALKSARVSGVAMVGPNAHASGLIKGLLASAPFDESRFPRLPWGGEAVATEDIQFIADWIDAGCPEDDFQMLQELEPMSAKGGIDWLKFGDVAEFEAFEGGVNAFDFRQPETRQRGNIDCLSEAELETLRRAYRKIYDLNDWPADRRSYNNQALIHQNHCQHGWERFLPWHRAYLYEFEQNLRDFEPDVMLPYWDWTMPHYCPETPEQGTIIPDALKAFFTVAAAEIMVTRLDPKPSTEQIGQILALAEQRTLFNQQHDVFVTLVNDIGYTAITPLPTDTNRQIVIDSLLASNPLWYPLRYPATYGNGGTINSVIHYHYPSGEDMDQILRLNNFRDFGGGSLYNDSFGFLDQNPHNTMHIWSGGMNLDAKAVTYDAEQMAAAMKMAATPLMPKSAKVAGRSFHKKEDLYSQPAVGDMFSNLTAAYDPIFWSLHANIDRTWSRWQEMNPDGKPLDQDAVLTPWSYTQRDMQSIEPFGYEYVRGGFMMPVGLEAPIGRFTSKPIKVAPKLRNFQSAEVRLHRVPQLNRSCFVRAFLNTPGADATTPVRGNPNFAGYLAIFGHGSCYGGPGHCDLPPANPRAGDHRPRHHNTPRNHRIDITEAARRILETDDHLTITLVVIGADYQEEKDLLKLEGVTLAFLD